MSNAPPGIPTALWKKMPEGARQVFGALQGEGGIAEMMLKPTFGEDEEGDAMHSQADLIADMFNVMRADEKQIGKAADVDISVERMTPERAAELVQGVVKGESLELIEQFNKLEDKRERILEELADEETVEKHRERKEAFLYTNDE